MPEEKMKWSILLSKYLSNSSAKNAHLYKTRSHLMAKKKTFNLFSSFINFGITLSIFESICAKLSSPLFPSFKWVKSLHLIVIENFKRTMIKLSTKKKKKKTNLHMKFCLQQPKKILHWINCWKVKIFYANLYWKVVWRHAKQPTRIFINWYLIKRPTGSCISQKQ